VRTTAVLRLFSTEVSGVLRSFRRRAWRSHALEYLLGIVLLVRFRSVSEMARRVGEERPDGLHHFLHDSPWNEGLVCWAIYERVFEVIRNTKQPVQLILDDTPVERSGKHIEGVGVHHSAKGLIKGHCAVTARVRSGKFELGWAVRGYQPKRGCPRGEFKSKVTLAMEIMFSAQVLGREVTLLIDSWYACKAILNRATAYGWRYVAAIKSNRVVTVNKRKTNVRNLAKGRRRYMRVKLSKRRTVLVAKRLVFLAGIGEVALFITKVNGHTKFLISNDVRMGTEEAVRQYAVRFGIETFHRDIKQHLGFGELLGRSWQGVQRHWTLCLLAYNTLQLWNASLPSRQRAATFGEIARSFRRCVSERSAVRWCASFRKAA
jgi:SRSO17 transposase